MFGFSPKLTWTTKIPIVESKVLFQTKLWFLGSMWVSESVNEWVLGLVLHSTGLLVIGDKIRWIQVPVLRLLNARHPHLHIMPQWIIRIMRSLWLDKFTHLWVICCFWPSIAWFFSTQQTSINTGGCLALGNAKGKSLPSSSRDKFPPHYFYWRTRD